MKASLSILFAAIFFLTILPGCKKKSADDPPAAATVYSVKHVVNPAPGRILVSPYNLSASGKGAVMILDERGNVLVQKETDGAAFCFRKWDINGTTRYTYIVNDPDTYHLPGINQLTGYVVVADSNLNEIRRVHLLPSGNITTGNTVDLDVHDFILIDDDHYISMSYYPKRVTNIPDSLHADSNVIVAAPVIQEVKNGSVIWQWDGSDFPEFYSASVEGNDFGDTTKAQDYMHMNSMIIDPRDNGLICSFRHLNEVIKIDKINGEILWRLGGKNSDFPLAPDQVFLRQHHVTLADNNTTLLMFDNGEAKERPSSRVLEFNIDESGFAVTGFKAFNIPEAFTQYMGSVQKISDHYFIGGGTAGYVLEINPATGEKVLELQSSEITYRAYKY